MSTAIHFLEETTKSSPLKVFKKRLHKSSRYDTGVVDLALGQVIK